MGRDMRMDPQYQPALFMSAPTAIPDPQLRSSSLVSREARDRNGMKSSFLAASQFPQRAIDTLRFDRQPGVLVHVSIRRYAGSHMP